jgi:4a-hydroxytetrahydrobiopterin dehydratase
MDWLEINDSLIKSFKTKDFRQAVAFIQLIAFEAEAMDHHPEIRNVYNLVEIKLCTHSAGNKVTSKDWELAERIDRAFGALHV